MKRRCRKCDSETEHYIANTGKLRCKPCQLIAVKNAKAKAKEARFNKKARDIAIGIVQPRQYNLMTAPVYTGEKWVDARGQMTPTKPYIGVTGRVQAGAV